MNTDKNDPNTDPTNSGNLNYCHTVRMFQLTSSGNYVFRTSYGFGPLLTRIMLQGEELPEMDGDPTTPDLKKHLPDCLFKRIHMRQAKKFGYYLNRIDFADFIQELEAADTRVRVVVFTTDTMVGHVETSPVPEDFPRDRDLKAALALRGVDSIFTQEATKREKKRMEAAAKANKTAHDSTAAPDSENPPIPVIPMTMHEIQPFDPDRDPSDPGPKYYTLYSRGGVDLQYFFLDPLAFPDMYVDGSAGSYVERRAHLPLKCMLRTTTFVPGNGQGPSSYIFHEKYLAHVINHFHSCYSEVTLTLHKLDGTTEVLIDAADLSDFDLEDLKNHQNGKYAKYLLAKAAHLENIREGKATKSPKSTKSPKPVA